MAEGPGVAVPPDSTGRRFRTQELTVTPSGGSPTVVEQEVVSIADAAGNLLGTAGTPFPVTNALTAKEFGAWSYYAGAAGTVTPAVGERIVGIIAHATGAGSMTIFGGVSIPIPANVGLEFEPKGNLVGDGTKTIVFTGTDTYTVEVIV